MAPVVTAHTADLEPGTLHAARALLDAAFAGDFSDEDWEHGLGGIHALAWEDGELVGHASLVQRRLLHGDRALRTGYVEAVAVRADRRRRGHAGALMAALERFLPGAYELGALSSAEGALAFYAGRGWQRWRGPTWALTPAGPIRTAGDDGSVHVLPLGVALDLDGALTCDWREGDVW